VVNRSLLVKQVYKHVAMFDKVNQYSNEFLSQNHQKKPFTLFYQMLQGKSDLKRRVSRDKNMLQPAKQADISRVRQNYIEKCKGSNLSSSMLDQHENAQHYFNVVCRA